MVASTHNEILATLLMTLTNKRPIPEQRGVMSTHSGPVAGEATALPP